MEALDKYLGVSWLKTSRQVLKKTKDTDYAKALLNLFPEERREAVGVLALRLLGEQVFSEAIQMQYDDVLEQVMADNPGINNEDAIAAATEIINGTTHHI